MSISLIFKTPSLPCKVSYGHFTGEVTGTQERLNFAYKNITGKR